MAAELVVERREGGRSSLALAPGRAATLGRSKESDCVVEGEPFLSRKHAELLLESGRLKVRRLPEAGNPVFYGGEERDSFSLAPGDFFVIGKTRFRFVLQRGEQRADMTDVQPASQGSLGAGELYALGADRMRLNDLLELPEVLRSGKDPASLHLHVAGLVRMAAGARWSCVLDQDGRILARDSADDLSCVQVSRSLMEKAKAAAPQPAFYCWAGQAGRTDATAVQGVDWAVCAWARISEASAVCIYCAGTDPRMSAESRALRDNARFVGLVADMVGRSLCVERLQTLEKRLERFFSGPIVSKILESPDLKELEPKRTQATVMFFDLRGFSKRTEDRIERILGVLGELRQVMTAMTQEILDEQGVVLEYIGDAILACWNVPFEDPRHVDRACRAALRMAATLENVAGGWRCGIGIHTGEVVAGAVGSEQIFSYTVLGAVVNQASRIEGITKVVESPILVTREVAERVSKDCAIPMRVGRFRPAGMKSDLDLYALTGSPGDPRRMESFAKGLAAFEKGDWEAAYDAFDELTGKDRPARFLKTLAEQHRRNPPKHWEGVIELAHK
ncbi:MAG: adenylate/guanylate cyclase domain-containing protein [Elusimicrobiota bacterium]